MAEAVLVQLLDGSVTVTVYVVGLETDFVAVVTPPPQLKVAPPVVDDAVNVTLAFVQVNDAGAAILALGGVFKVSVPLPVTAPQALPLYVTVYVVVAAGVMVIDAVVAPPGDHK